MRAQIVNLKPEHIDAVLARMEVSERTAFLQLCSAEELRIGAALSDPGWCALIDDMPVCAGGIRPMAVLSREGVAWMITTPELRRAPRVLVWGSRHMLKVVRERYDVVRNMMGCDPGELRWLRWLGFELGEPVSINGVMHRPAELRL